MPKAYIVEWVGDDPDELSVALNTLLAEHGGRAVNVTWQPERKNDGPSGRYPAGYTIVFESDDA